MGWRELPTEGIHTVTPPSDVLSSQPFLCLGRTPAFHTKRPRWQVRKAKHQHLLGRLLTCLSGTRPSSSARSRPCQAGVAGRA